MTSADLDAKYLAYFGVRNSVMKIGKMTATVAPHRPWMLVSCLYGIPLFFLNLTMNAIILIVNGQMSPEVVAMVIGLMIALALILLPAGGVVDDPMRITIVRRHPSGATTSFRIGDFVIRFSIALACTMGFMFTPVQYFFGTEWRPVVYMVCGLSIPILVLSIVIGAIISVIYSEIRRFLKDPGVDKRL